MEECDKGRAPKSAAAFWGFSRGGFPKNTCIGGAIAERNFCEICRRKSPQNTEKHKTKLCAEVPERPLPKDPFFQLLTKKLDNCTRPRHYQGCLGLFFRLFVPVFSFFLALVTAAGSLRISVLNIILAQFPLFQEHAFPKHNSGVSAVECLLLPALLGLWLLFNLRASAFGGSRRN